MRSCLSLAMPLFSCGVFCWAGCSFSYGTVERVDTGPRPDAPITGCHVIDQTGCSGGACQADVDDVGRIETTCHPSGSSSTGGYCVDHSFCGNGLACWDNRDGSGDGTCYAVCFTGATCPFGTHCDSTTTLFASYGGRAAFPCTPDTP